MIVSNTISIGWDELSGHKREKLKRKLTFSLPDGNYCQCYREYPGLRLEIPRGAWHLVENLDYIDKRSRPKLPKLNFKVTLDDTSLDERFKGQRQAVKEIFEHEQGLIVRPPGCIAGDAIIEVNRAGKSFKITIRELVDRLNGGRAYWGRKWDMEIPTKVRARYPDGSIRLTEITDSWECGVKTVYEVETKDGRKVRASADHPFLTVRGWRKLSQLRVGDKVIMDGGKSESKGRGKKPLYREIQGLIGHPYALERPHRGYSRWSVPAHRIAVEAELNKLPLEEYVAALRLGESNFTFLDPAWVVHHEDGNTLNNSLSNLRVVESPSVHAAEHGVNGGWRKVTAQDKEVRIVRIVKVGKEETFDIEVAEVSNYLANGFVVHNTGKTQIALAFAAQAETRTLVLVQTKDILDQWVEYAERAIPGVKLGIIQGQKQIIGHITIAMMQTIRNFVMDGRHQRDWWAQFGAVILDEAQHGAASSFEVVMNQLPAFYRLGFTASPTRADGMHPYLKHLIGPVIHKQKFSSPIDLKVNPLYSDFNFPYRGSYDWQRLINALISNEGRNRQIAEVIDREVHGGNSVLVLSRRIEQLDNLSGLLASENRVLVGQRCSLSERREILREFRAGRIPVLFATQLADEALDVPRCNRVVLAHPGKAEGRIIQQVGRALRAHPDKENARIIDVVDKRVRPLNNQWRERKRVYRKEGISIAKRNLWEVVNGN